MMSIDGTESKHSQITVTTKPLGLGSDNSLAPERDMNRGFESYGNSMPSTPTSATTSRGFDTDMEAMKQAESTEQLRDAYASGNRLDSDSSVWPGQAHWREKALAAKRKNRSCHCLARLSKRTRIVVKLAIVLFILGVAVAVGFGISKSLGARIWKPEDDRR
ncbi:hypothetical protein F5Y14DRAFT_103474 [Nemania sp. NC0429]|nr:hypothetical protein F5Y14DRAFT_103474 [Nemania sp. NC0429]